MISPKMAVHLVQQAQKHNEMATQKQNEMGSLGGYSPHCWLNPSKILVDSAIDRLFEYFLFCDFYFIFYFNYYIFFEGGLILKLGLIIRRL